jgi:hypothetical protein
MNDQKRLPDFRDRPKHSTTPIEPRAMETETQYESAVVLSEISDSTAKGVYISGDWILGFKGSATQGDKPPEKDPCIPIRGAHL